MKKNIFWKSAEYNSMENCNLAVLKTCIKTHSKIAGVYDNKIFSVNYVLKTTLAWEFISAQISYELENVKRTMVIKRGLKNSWTVNGKIKKGFSGCTDIDISLTPFTNSLPVNRVKFAGKKSEEIRVVYVDIMEQTISPALQNYTKISKNRFRFQNIPNDFEAVIEFDDYGLVKYYPGLFETVRHLNKLQE